MYKIILLTGVLSLLTATSAWAGTVVEVQNKGELTTVLTNGQQARMNMSGAEYVIVDYRKQQMKVVNPQKQQVMLLDAKNLTSADSTQAVRTSVNRVGNGPVIAGYQTQKYQYTANGKSCGVIYGSKAAFNAKGINELFQAIKTMMQQQRAAIGGFTGFIDDCTLADMQVINHVTSIGVPMRTERNGMVDSEVKSINIDVNLPANTFVIPTSYKTVTMQDAIKASSEDMAKARQHSQQPQVQDMMQQMHQSGQMTPEMMQQMQRAQEMMKRYQQR